MIIIIVIIIIIVTVTTLIITTVSIIWLSESFPRLQINKSTLKLIYKSSSFNDKYNKPTRSDQVSQT